MSTRKQLGSSICKGLAGFLLAAVTVVAFPATAMAESFLGVNGRLMFSDVNGFDLKSVKTDGTDRTDVSSATGAQTDAEYSPDGTKIVYRQVVSGVDQVMVANADGSNPQQLTSGSDFSFTPSWSPDGTKIVYIHEVSTVQHIYRMDADGNNKTQLTNSGEYFDPEYSPDGTKIIALLDASDDEVVVMNADGTNIVNLTNNSVDDFKANWSPNGSKITYASTVSGERQIFTMSADGSDKTQLTNVGFGGYHKPVYSPDGTKIAFIDTLAPSPIYTMNADGSAITEVPNSGWALEVSWQPLTRAPSTTTPNPTISLSNGKATINIASMYTDTYEGISTATVAATSTPASGTTSVDASTGVITYSYTTTAAGSSFWSNLGSLFFPKVSAAAATDSFGYRVCSLANSSLCSTGTVTVTLLGVPATGAGQQSAPHYLAWLLAGLSAAALWLGVRRLRQSTTRQLPH